jgi:hypothetical protein
VNPDRASTRRVAPRVVRAHVAFGGCYNGRRSCAKEESGMLLKDKVAVVTGSGRGIGR